MTVHFRAVTDATAKGLPMTATPPPQGPPPGFGYGVPPLPEAPKSRRTLWIVLGIVAVAVILVAGGLGIALTVGSSDDARGGRTDTQQVSDVAHAFTDAASKGDATAARATVCESDKSRYSNLSTQPLAQPLPAFTLVNVVFKGPDASGVVKTTGQPDGSIYFHKDDKDWKLCPSSKAKF